jgi:hypothetical protein
MKGMNEKNEELVNRLANHELRTQGGKLQFDFTVEYVTLFVTFTSLTSPS